MAKKKLQIKSGLTKRASEAIAKLPMEVILGKSPKGKKNLRTPGIFTKGK